jgi:hypothetical protein
MTVKVFVKVRGVQLCNRVYKQELNSCIAAQSLFPKSKNPSSFRVVSDLHDVTWRFDLSWAGMLLATIYDAGPPSYQLVYQPFQP